jgi:hypothetical protein
MRIGALVRLYAPNGTVAAEKEISHCSRTEYGGRGVAQFVQRVVTDPDITARLKGTPR